MAIKRLDLFGIEARAGLTFKVHGAVKADLVPSLKHTGFEVEVVDAFLRLRDDE
jgi:hypothetical protein